MTDSSTTDAGEAHNPAQPALSNDLSEAVLQVDNAAAAMGGQVLGLLWKMIARYRGRMWAAILFGVASGVCQIVPPAAAGMMVAEMVAGDMNAALIWAVVVLIGGVLLTVLFSASMYISHLIAADVQADQRRAIGEKLKTVPLGFFSRVSSVDLRRVLVDDIEQLEDGIAHLIPEVTAAYVAPVLIFILMGFVDWRLAIAATAPTVMGFVIMSYMMRKGIETSNEYMQTQAGIAAAMSEVARAIPVVKTYNNGDAALRRADAAIQRYDTVLQDWIQYAIVPSNWFFLLASSNLIFVTPLSIWLWSEGEASLAVITFFHLAAMSLALLVSGLFGVNNRFRKQEGLLARRQVLISQAGIAFAEAGPVPATADVRFEDVTFGYGDTPVIRGVSLEVPAGSSLALVGPSGSGKTTLARLLARFWEVDGGAIRIGGEDIRDLTPETHAEALSFVFQEIFLFTRSVADNILIGRPEASREEVIAAAKAARAHDFIEALPQGYDTVISGNLGLSVGQKQRLSIARALLRNAPILVLDEATAFSDPENEQEVQQAISALARDKTLIVIAHRLSTIQHADKIAFLKDGKITETGTHAELLAAGGDYAAQWEAHAQARAFKLSNTSGEEA